MVVETTGAWYKGAAVVLNHIARAAAARTGEDAGTAQTALMQELSVVVRSWRAQAADARPQSEVAVQGPMSDLVFRGGGKLAGPHQQHNILVSSHS